MCAVFNLNHWDFTHRQADLLIQGRNSDTWKSSRGPAVKLLSLKVNLCTNETLLWKKKIKRHWIWTKNCIKPKPHTFKHEALVYIKSWRSKNRKAATSRMSFQKKRQRRLCICRRPCNESKRTKPLSPSSLAEHEARTKIMSERKVQKEVATMAN